MKKGNLVMGAVAAAAIAIGGNGCAIGMDVSHDYDHHHHREHAVDHRHRHVEPVEIRVVHPRVEVVRRVEHVQPVRHDVRNETRREDPRKKREIQHGTANPQSGLKNTRVNERDHDRRR